MPVIGTRGNRAASGLGFNGDGFTPQALALFARMSPTPSPSRKVLINQTIAALIGAGVWTKLSMLKVQAAHSSQAALLNWVSTSYPSSTVNSPTFTTDRGYAGDGVSSYVASGYVPSADSNWTSTDHSFGRVLNTFAGGYDFGLFDNGASKYAYVNTSGLGTSVTVGDSGYTGTSQTISGQTHVTASRVSDSGYVLYSNGAFLATETVSGGSASSIEMRIGSVEVTYGGPSAYSASRVSAVYVGKGLTSGEALALYTALQNYMTGVGA